MQPRTASPREALTAAQVDAILTGPSLKVSTGLEAVDTVGNVLQDLSDILEGGLVKRSNYATLHGTCSLKLTSAAISWGTARLRPFMTLQSQGLSARFDLGVYLPTTPRRSVGETPETVEVEGYDLLTILDTPAGQTFRAPAGANVVETVQAILDDHGAGTPHFIEASSEVLASDRLYPLDDKTTWLEIVNELLAAVGYRGLWADWTGRFRSAIYRSPATRATEFTYGADVRSTILHPERTVEEDFFQAPNRWVFVRNDPDAGASLPGSGDVYERTNPADGPTSIAGRNLTVTRVEFVDATSTEALQAQGDAMVEADRRLDASYSLTADPNPLHWHFDVVTIDDPLLGAPVKAVVQSWALDLGGGAKTSLTLRKV